MKIVICGSISLADYMMNVQEKLFKNGHEVILPKNAKKYAEKILKEETSSDSVKNKIEEDLIKNHFLEIKVADAILIINIDKRGIKNYLGGNAFLEMGFAHVLDKKIFLLNEIPDVSYKDEIEAMQPIILNGDLSRIN